MARKDFAAMEARGPSGASAARAAMRSRIGHPSSVRLEEVQLNPLNPRYDEDDPAVRELADTLRHVGQLQPALVISREQFLRAYPDQHAVMGPQPWVVIVGNRRLVASRLAGRAALDVRVDADLDSPEELEDRVLIENIQRKDLPPLLEAAHLQRRLSRPGQTMRSVGEAVGKSHAYVQQRLDLLKMIPEFQEMFRAGTVNIKIGRQLGTLSEDDQRAVLAAGPPYASSPRPTVTLHSSTAGGENASTPAGPAPAPAVHPVSSPAGESDRTAQVESGGAANGAAVASTADVPAAGADAEETAGGLPGAVGEVASPGLGSGSGSGSGSERFDSPDRSGSSVASAVASVGRWLDNALADLDRLPGEDATAVAVPAAFSAVRRLIADARAELDQVASRI